MLIREAYSWEELVPSNRYLHFLMNNSLVLDNKEVPCHAIDSNANSIPCPQFLVGWRGKYLLLVEVDVSLDKAERAHALSEELLMT